MFELTDGIKDILKKRDNDFSSIGFILKKKDKFSREYEHPETGRKFLITIDSIEVEDNNFTYQFIAEPVKGLKYPLDIHLLMECWPDRKTRPFKFDWDSTFDFIAKNIESIFLPSNEIIQHYEEIAKDWF